jgi:deoxyribodipyrimidine photo-lyase
MSSSPALVWFRHDLRLDDNPALRAAVTRGGPVVPVFIWDPESEGAWPMGGAARWWLHGSLMRLGESLRKAGSRLIVRRGDSLTIIRELIEETGAAEVVWNRRYEPVIVERDSRVKAELRRDGISAESFNSHLLFEPWSVQTKAGTPFKVFTPFYRACLALPEPDPPIAAPKTLRSPQSWPRSRDLAELPLLPRIPWDAGIRDAWSPGEPSALAKLDQFRHGSLTGYMEIRNRPDQPGTSRLSPHLRFGEISPRRIWHELRDVPPAQDASGFLREVVWREFAYHLLFHFPRTVAEPLNSRFARFPWRDDNQLLRAWQKGKTGYPIVDAGMRELWTTGWMHNRVRMVVGSFLVKDLLLPWQRGAEWFWDTLVDADLANNTLGWQWVAGCGADAAPFFRVFNPVLQGEKFDPDGAYVRQWVPEIATLPARWLHQPWKAPEDVLAAAGIVLGRSYPRPIVDHDEARRRAIELYESATA